jgi:DNA-binding FadR family transcriptional regulator
MRRYAVEKQKLSEQVAALLEREIVTGERKVGEQLPSERALMELFGVGRPTIREALYSLQRKGLVGLRSGTRARVTQPTPDGIVNAISGAACHFLEQPRGQEFFQEARTFFEVGLVRFAAERANAEDLRKLEDALAANGEALGNREWFKDTDIGFHYVLAEIPGNPIFPAIHNAMVQWLTDQRETTLQVPGQMEIAYKAHERIYRAVASGSPDRSEKAMLGHLQQLYSIYQQVKRQSRSGPIRVARGDSSTR